MHSRMGDGDREYKMGEEWGGGGGAVAECAAARRVLWRSGTAEGLRPVATRVAFAPVGYPASAVAGDGGRHTGMGGEGGMHSRVDGDGGMHIRIDGRVLGVLEAEWAAADAAVADAGRVGATLAAVVDAAGAALGGCMDDGAGAAAGAVGDGSAADGGDGGMHSRIGGGDDGGGGVFERIGALRSALGRLAAARSAEEVGAIVAAEAPRVFDADAAALIVRGDGGMDGGTDGDGGMDSRIGGGGGGGEWRVADARDGGGDAGARNRAGGGGCVVWRPVRVTGGLTARAIATMAPLACNDVAGSDLFDPASDVAAAGGGGGGGAFMVAPVAGARDAAAAVVQIAGRAGGGGDGGMHSRIAGGAFSSLDVRLLQVRRPWGYAYRLRIYAYVEYAARVSICIRVCGAAHVSSEPVLRSASRRASAAPCGAARPACRARPAAAATQALRAAGSCTRPTCTACARAIFISRMRASIGHMHFLCARAHWAYAFPVCTPMGHVHFPYGPPIGHMRLPIHRYELSMLTAGVLADALGVSEASLLPFDATRREVRRGRYGYAFRRRRRRRRAGAVGAAH